MNSVTPIRDTPVASATRSLFALSLFAFFAILDTPVMAAPPGYTIFWSDEFHQGVSAQPNTAVWNYDLGGGGWGNNEWQTYVSSFANCHIVADSNATDGQALRIEVQKDSAGNYYSARINTGGKVFPQYGYMEARLRLPYSQGMWPAFWMLGNNIGSVGWPACGELDIMECLGNAPSVNYGSFHATGWDASASYTNPGGTWFSDTYHLFQCNWTPNCISFAVDGVVYSTRTINDTTGAWPFNNPMFFILNLAVGGNWPGPPNSSTIVPMDYYIDYVRAYRLTGIPSNKVISLFSLASNKFVCADNYGSSNLIANRTTAGGWEQFRVIDRGNGNVALQSLANNKYVTAENAGSSPLVASRTTISTWETFKWEPHADGSVSLKSLANNKYVCADSNISNPPQLIANRTTAGAWESFCVTCY